MYKLVRVMVGLAVALPLIAAPTIIQAQTTQNPVTVTTPVFTCGSSYSGVAVTCTGSSGSSTRPVHAREIDTAFAISGLILAIGCLAILRARKRS